MNKRVETKLQKAVTKAFQQGHEVGVMEGRKAAKEEIQALLGIEKCHCDSCTNY